MDEINNCASERSASSLLACYAERSQSWTQSIKHRAACRIHLIHSNYSIYLKSRETGRFLKKLITYDEKDIIVPAFSSILLGHIRPSPQQEVPRLRALHPQVPVQRQTSEEKANDTGTTATFEAGKAS